MGGCNDNENFILNCTDWELVRNRNRAKVSNLLEKDASERIPALSIAPMTGAVENIGFPDERSYYADIVQAVHRVGVGLCIGDGFPDDKLKFGIHALQEIQQGDEDAETAVFIKPYTNEQIFERIEWTGGCAKSIGIDIDSYNILTMRSLVRLEKKTSAQLIEIKRHIHSPFILKGIFSEEDIDLLREVKPDVAYISNHGGRIETRRGSTAEFCEQYGARIKNFCGEVWIDGGIRTPLDVATAMALGADRILVGRPFATALCHGGADELCKKVLELSLIQFAF